MVSNEGGTMALVGLSVRTDESTSTIWMDGCEGERLDLAVSGLDDSCFAFFPRRLGRFPKSNVLGNDFLLSPAEGQA